MGTVTYTVIDGEIMSECRNGIERDYMPDIQGNTIALLDSTQTMTDTFTYCPYGEVKSRTGSTATPFQYLGTLGYYTDSSTKSYVRARYLGTQKGRWMTTDPIWITGGDWNLYGYTQSNPVSSVDPTGERAISCGTFGPDLPKKDPAYSCLAKVCARHNYIIDTLFKMESDLCNGFFASIGIRCLPDIPKGWPGYVEGCDISDKEPSGRMGRLPWFPNTGFCAQEFGVRFWTWISTPNSYGLERWWNAAVRHCQKTRMPIPDHEIYNPYKDCLNPPDITSKPVINL